jgi:hypothetical protein
MLGRVVDELRLPDSLRNPYYAACKAIINVTAQHHVGLGFDPKDPVDFIFDEQSEKDKVIDGWRSGYRDSVSDDVRAITGKDPIFRNDEKFLPLQAADIYAWWSRKRWEEHGTIALPSLPFPWSIKRDVRRLVMEFSEADLRAELIKVRRMLDDEYGPKVNVTVNFNFTEC